MEAQCKARGCDATFIKRVRTQRYCSPKCQKREADRRRQNKVRRALKAMDAERSKEG